MNDFTARKALSTGFDLIRRRPLLILLWAALSLALAAVTTIAYQTIVRPARASALTAVLHGHQQASVLLGQSLLYGFVDGVLSLIVASVLWTSAFRAILRPHDRPLVRLGREEMLVVVVRFLVGLAATLAVVAIQWLSITSHTAAFTRPMAGVIGALDLFWGSVATVWAFGRAEIAPLRCWSIARGRFWTLAGLSVGLAALVPLGNLGLHQLIMAGLNHHAPFPVPGAAQMITPPLLVQMVASSALRVLDMALLAGVVAAAYRAPGAKPQAASPTFGSAAASPS